ncbi:hypothetical protein BJ138DRAFT_1114713 [Hygrophoropsis aurantiaca]|uniref:Uncharacterized protein n=1 Tax=Hygrophoropsis aurantiaca TaxID=72124 RepID=A0ACB8A959_9AGAM|nr:hypothetical protein BJ138DRAFT_1114713 [Hygrophoropsis aurantiaca]
MGNSSSKKIPKAVVDPSDFDRDKLRSNTFEETLATSNDPPQRRYSLNMTESSTLYQMPVPRTHRRVRSTVHRRHEAPPPPYPSTSSGIPSVEAVKEEADIKKLPQEHPRVPMYLESKEDALETLRKYDTVILMDDSRSMEGPLWAEARDALSLLAEIAVTYDADGIDLYFLNDARYGKGLKDSAAVKKLFRDVKPSGATPIGQGLESLILPYLASLDKARKRRSRGDNSAAQQVKPVNYIVITDGAPTDEPEEVIVATAKRLDAHHHPLTQLGIQFVQIGRSRKAAAYLQELDDALGATHGIRDIVDTTPYSGEQLTAEMLIKILLGGINRRVDRRGAAAVMD